MVKNNLFYQEPKCLTPLSKYIIDGKINIDEFNWKQLNLQYNNDELIDFLTNEVISGNIKFPYRDISIQDAVESFIQLQNYNPLDFEYSKIHTKFEYKYPIDSKFLCDGIIGGLASDYFQQQNRFMAEGRANPSPIRTWNTEKMLRTLFKALWSLKCKRVDSATFRTIIALRKYTASQFRPAVAKSIYTKYNSKDVLDFSAGWGDRLCGFYATPTTKSYIGIDPNVNTYNQYFKQAELYNSICGGKKTKFINLPAEDVRLEKDIVDTVFTSPPYFDAEKYTNSTTQSFVRYKTVDKWLNGFMYPTLENVWNSLIDGGYLIINISDMRSNGTVNKLCDPMNDYIKDNLGGTYIDGYGMKMSKRPQSDSDDGNSETTFIEPIWVWRK